MTASTSEQTRRRMWDRVGILVDRSPSPAAIHAHGLGLLAVRRWRAAGRQLPEAFLAEERSAALVSMIAPTVLGRIRDAVDQPVLVLKGPVIAQLYPGGLRSYNDLDLLVRDAAAAQAALLADGFAEVDDPDFEDFSIEYHLRPLALASLPLKVEIHDRPNWPPHLPRLPLEEIFDAAVDSGLGIDGLLTPAPLHHALLLAGHAWTHDPLGSLRDITEIALLSQGLTDAELAGTAERWGMGRVWRTTCAGVREVFGPEGRRDVSLRVWARHLRSARERTVLEEHLARLLSPFWTLPLPRAFAESAYRLACDLRPLKTETWAEKLRRSWRSLLHASVPRSENVRRTTPGMHSPTSRRHVQRTLRPPSGRSPSVAEGD